MGRRKRNLPVWTPLTKNTDFPLDTHCVTRIYTTRGGFLLMVDTNTNMVYRQAAGWKKKYCSSLKLNLLALRTAIRMDGFVFLFLQSNFIH
jgi:hypothetical protein